MTNFSPLAFSPSSGTRHGTGWIAARPDLRDYGLHREEVSPALGALGLDLEEALGGAEIPDDVDLRPWCSPIRDQGAIGSCTAQAAVGIVEYYVRRAGLGVLTGSPLFTYKATRELLGWEGDTGAWIRTAMGSLVLCGVAPERYWEYTDADPEYDAEPPAFVFSVAENFEALQYVCHDPLDLGLDRDVVLASVKTLIAAGVPSMFGFYGFDSFDFGDQPGHIPMPCADEKAEWGHAVVAVGYDDHREVTNTLCDYTTTGALLIRNSWGEGWGDQGYGWIPYDYLRTGLADDFWSLFSMEWVDTDQFGL